MFVSRLDRPWLETPFLFQGFYIRTPNDIKTLKKYCIYVYINTEKMPLSPDKIEIFSGNLNHGDSNSLPNRSKVYKDRSLVEEEIKFAKQCHESLVTHFKQLLIDVQDGRSLALTEMQKSISGMVDSIVRIPDAFLWLTTLKNIDSYAYKHAIGSSVLAVSFGRHLGLSIPELNDLATGVLLCDIGKSQLPKELLTKPGRLSDEEFSLVKTHVSHSVKLMTNTSDIGLAAIEIAQHHHERHNGTGYPQGLSGKQIPVFARIAAIVDCYDAITTKRPYSNALSSLEAIKSLYEWRDLDFQKELVEEFIQCLGIFPTGSIVELSDGHIGIVLSQNRVRRLRPRIMLVLDSNHTMLGHLPVIDLAVELTDKDNNPLEIITTHEPWAFGIDPSVYFL